MLTVKVTLFGYDVPLGQVQVKEGSKASESSGWRPARTARVTIRLKKLKIGKHKLTVTYLGSVSTLALDGEDCHAQGGQEAQEEVARM